MTSVLYLHGFASSPRSDKPIALSQLLDAHGVVLDVPDLNVPSFEALDFDAMVDRALEHAALTSPAVVVGSSLGSAVALEALRRGLRAPAILIAPAIGISDLWISRCPAGDPIAVWNHARNANAMIHRAFFEQMARRAVEFPPPAVPVIIFMGTEDESIPFERVRGVWDRWRAGRLNDRSRFVAVEGGDHRLTDQIGPVAEEIRSLLATSAQV